MSKNIQNLIYLVITILLLSLTASSKNTFTSGHYNDKYSLESSVFSLEFKDLIELIKSLFNNNVGSDEISVKNSNWSFTNKQIDLLMKSQDFNFIKTTNATGDQAIEIGEILIDNQIFINHMWEPVRYQKHIDWDADPFYDNSWKLYLHGFYPVSYLLNAYEETSDEKYLNKAKEITLDWIENNPNNSISSDWAWADHAVSMRLITMTHILEIFKANDQIDYEFLKKLFISIKEHIEYQLSEEKYRFPHNHGVIQDRSIIQTALTLFNVKESELWLSIAINRLDKQIDSFVSESGVHLEHSPFYHLYIIKLYASIEEMLSSSEFTLNNNINGKLSKMVDYLVYVTKPNMMLPHIGDTTDTKIESDYENEYLKFVITEGLEGTKPIEIDKVYLDAGIAVFRDEWKSGKSYKEMTHLVFQAGYHSNVHKHADDLSFVLSSLGEDIFIDAGKYTYTDDIWRDYFISSQSHNTITVDNQSYKVKENKNHGSFIIDYTTQSNYSWIKGEHNLIPGVKYSREILFIKPNNLLIFDKLMSGSVHSYQQNFNLGKLFEINESESGRNYIAASTPDKDILISIKQLINTDDYRIFKGIHLENSNTNPVRGYASERTNELIEITQVEFEKQGKNVEFITLITIDSPKYTTNIDNIQINNYETREIRFDRNNIQEIIILPK